MLFPIHTPLRLLVAALAVSSALRAQTYEQVAPKKLPSAAPAVLPEPETPTAAAADENRVLVPALRGLVFLQEPSAIRPSGRVADGVDVAAVPLLDHEAFRARLAPYLGRPLTLASLHLITRETVLWLRAQDRPVVDVVVPEQNIQSGTVQILIVQGRLGSVRAEGNRWFPPERIVRAVRIAPGEVIVGSSLLADMAWVNQNPFRHVDLVFSRGANPGETDIVLRTRDRRPWRLYTGYENTGTPLTDEDRVLAGVNWGDAFGLDQQLNYQLSASPDFDRFVAHSGSYVVPLPWRHTLTLFGSYATSRPDLSGGLFNMEGESWQASARYNVPLPVWRGVEQSFSAGFDFKRSNNNLAFGGAQVFAQSTDVVQAVLAYSASRADAHGLTTGELTLAFSPGGIGGRNSDPDYQAVRAGADADYFYARLDLTRTTTLPAGFSWVVAAQGQVATTNLLGSEQLGFGGAESLRGYDEREVNGDDGFILVNELHAPAFGVARRLGFDRVPDQFELLAFMDAGVAVLEDPQPGEERNRELWSVGAGFRYRIATNVSARFDYGWQLRDSGVSPTGDNRRAHISVIVSY